MSKRGMKVCNRLAAIFAVLARVGSYIDRQCTRAQWALAYCERCGEKRYYGKTCREVLGS